MKKLGSIIFVIGFVLSSIFVMNTPIIAAEKTLGTHKKELAALEEKLKANESEQAATEEQRKQTKANIENTKAEIQKTNDDINRLAAEIEKLNKDIENKDKEIKNIINFIQVANGESAYMEYIFGAKDFTDFIYRVAVSEQMVDYNETLIAEFNELIKQNNQKTEELKNKQVELANKKQQLELEMSKLGQKISNLQEGEQDLASEIKTKKETIKGLENQGCRDSETVTTCYQRLHPPASNNDVNTGGGNIQVPYGKFTRPLNSAYVSSEYGYRYHPTQGIYKLHTGIDLAASGGSVPVYASTNGTVGAIIRRASCGGNQVYIHHVINGKTYTTGYMHLRSINVSLGQSVSPNSVIGTMGGDPRQEYWDSCSTGQHLHFMIATGLYYVDYSNYNTFVSHLLNPRNAIAFPSTGGSFSGRL